MDKEALRHLQESVLDNNGCVSWNEWLKDENIDIDLSGVYLAGANLSGADLSNADLTGADLSGANLAGAILSHANLTDADLSKTHLDAAQCFKTDFTGANLFGVDFGTADLSWAKLRKTNLTDASLSKAKIWKTDFRESRGAPSVDKTSDTGEYLVGGAQTFSFQFNDERLDAICRNIGKACGTQLLLGEEVDPRKRISLSIVKKTLPQIMDQLCQTARLSYKSVKGSIGEDTFYLSGS
jgi:uncharacterized protein YaaQ